jgi:hypothetical protein
VFFFSAVLQLDDTPREPKITGLRHIHEQLVGCAKPKFAAMEIRQRQLGIQQHNKKTMRAGARGSQDF